jgi:starvation-inducible DNA-binding protein
MAMAEFTSALADDDKAVAGAALNRALVDLVDLSLVAKQAHWNLVGKGFRSLHLQLDEVVDAVRIFADDVAERAVTIGVAPDGRAGTVAKESAIAEHPAGWIQDTDVVEYFVAALKVAIGRLRKGIEETAEADIVSQDMLIGITAALEKHLWMFQVER